MKKNYKILELDKIIDLLTQEIQLESNKSKMDPDLLIMNDIDDIKQALEEVDEASVIISRLNRFPLLFKKDTRIYINKTKKFGVLTPQELLEIGKLLDTTKSISIFDDSLDSYEIVHERLHFYNDLLIYNKNLNLRIKEIVNNFGEILDSASFELARIRKEIDNTLKTIQTKLIQIVNANSSRLTSTIISTRNDRYVIPVKNDYKNQVKGIIHDISSSGETVFIEPLIICELNNKLNSLHEDEKQEIDRILREISKEISENSDDLLRCYQVIEVLDLIFSKASLSIKLNGNKVNINEKGKLELLNCYHPLLNVSKIVKNNVIIGNRYQLDKSNKKYKETNEEINGVIITGPNTGGKTVLLKTIGLLSLMVKMGLLIPCDPESNICIFDDVYADIGDEQSIDQNLSTFSSHLKNIIEIMNEVSENSLVILDELGSGTDPSEGAALAISIFDYLINKKCLVIASTHYAEMKIHAYESNNIINASVEFDINTLRPTYKLLMGIPGESNALKISEILGLPKEIIDKAKDYATSNSNELDSILSKLINQSNALESKLNELRDKDYRLQKKYDEVTKVLEETKKEKKKIISDANIEAEKLIKESIKKAQDLIEKLDAMKDQSNIKVHEIASAKHELKELKGNIDYNIDISSDSNEEIRVNDKVFIEKYNTTGTVIKINKNRYDVSIGNTVMTLKKDDLKITNEVMEVPVKKTGNIVAPRKTVMASLDLRGMRYEDAEPLIENYLADASFAGLHQVSIIHGFGTGVIRELVQSKLKNNPYVDSYRYGGQNEGGQGVTVVTLK